MDCTTCKRIVSGNVAVLARTASATCFSASSFPLEPAIWLNRSSALSFVAFVTGLCSTGLYCSISAPMLGVAGIPDGEGWAGGAIISCAGEGWFTGSGVTVSDGDCASGCTMRVTLPGFASSFNHVDEAAAVGVCGAGDTGLTG